MIFSTTHRVHECGCERILAIFCHFYLLRILQSMLNIFFFICTKSTTTSIKIIWVVSCIFSKDFMFIQQIQKGKQRNKRSFTVTTSCRHNDLDDAYLSPKRLKSKYIICIYKVLSVLCVGLSYLWFRCILVKKYLTWFFCKAPNVFLRCPDVSVVVCVKECKAIEV